ncbi:hypothetical protein EJB05_09010, partial [Eragrostis curvula]
MLTTMSTCTEDTEQGKHVFRIFDYSKHRGIGIGEFIKSGTFSIGGHNWAVRFYPDGLADSTKNYISIYLELLDKDTKVRASCDIMLVNQTTGQPTFVSKTELKIFNSSDKSRFAPQSSQFMNRSELEASPYLRNDRLTIHCSVTVWKKPHVSNTKPVNQIVAPPSDIAKHFGTLLDAQEGADVTFSVGDESFTAHRIVLAARSPVFKAELYGPMREARSDRITIDDMQPAVFRSLMHFIYTDSLPKMDDLMDAHHCDMIQHLLVAADRYAMDRLKLVCQSILCNNLNVETVSSTLALAFQHNCERLKDMCIYFITSSNVMDELVETAGYENLKTTCPSALADAFEKTMRRKR